MKKHYYLLILFSIAVILIACKVNPFTGKSTLDMYQSSEHLFPMAFQEYDKFLSENTVIKNTKESQMITTVGQKIANAADKWLKANGYPDYLKDYKWEYNLVEDDNVNAWCMPGGEIVFYTGILPFSRSHETEADKIGLNIMAIAGYNPDEAAKLWVRMKSAHGSSTPEFLSTHPSNDTRIKNLTKWAPEAKAEAK